jgi:hypothetical protein
MFSKWRFILILLLAFPAWVFLIGPLLPSYAKAVVPTAQWALNGLQLHGAWVTFAETCPDVRWHVVHPSLELGEDSVSFRLLTYNLILYLALLTAVPRLRLVARLVLLATALPVFWAFHVLDLLLLVESRTLTGLQPQHYEFWRHFNPWFVAVKFYGSFSAMALKQILPIVVMVLQWHVLTGLGARETQSQA